MAKVLLVEDDAIVQHVHVLMLNKLGHLVELADTGAQALTLLQTHSDFDIIFVDIGLPDMDGIELTKVLREFIPNKTFPIIALTGFIGEKEKSACLTAGVSEVLHKPVLIKKLMEILDQYLH